MRNSPQLRRFGEQRQAFHLNYARNDPPATVFAFAVWPLHDPAIRLIPACLTPVDFNTRLSPSPNRLFFFHLRLAHKFLCTAGVSLIQHSAGCITGAEPAPWGPMRRSRSIIR